MREKNQKVFSIAEWDPKIFRAILEFMVTDQIPASLLMPNCSRLESFSHLLDLAIAARYFLLDGLISKIEKWLIFEFLDGETICDLANFSFHYQLTNLSRACKYKLLSNLDGFQDDQLDLLRELHPKVVHAYLSDPNWDKAHPLYQLLLEIPRSSNDTSDEVLGEETSESSYSSMADDDVNLLYSLSETKLPTDTPNTTHDSNNLLSNNSLSNNSPNNSLSNNLSHRSNNLPTHNIFPNDLSHDLSTRNSNHFSYLSSDHSDLSDSSNTLKEGWHPDQFKSTLHDNFGIVPTVDESKSTSDIMIDFSSLNLVKQNHAFSGKCTKEELKQGSSHQSHQTDFSSFQVIPNIANPEKRACPFEPVLALKKYHLE